MARIFLEIFLPGNSKSYEFQLDDCLKVEECAQKIKDQIEAFEGMEITFDTSSVLLCNMASQQVLKKGMRLQAAGIKSGDKLLLL